MAFAELIAYIGFLDIIKNCFEIINKYFCGVQAMIALLAGLAKFFP